MLACKNSAGRSAAGKGRMASSAKARSAATKAANRNTPERLDRAASLRIDRAMANSPGNADNFVKLLHLRQRLGGTREQQDALLRRARLNRTHSLDSHEGLHGPKLTEAERAAGIPYADTRLIYITRVGDSSLAPARGTGRGRRR